MEAGLMWWARVFRQVILGREKTPCPWGRTYTKHSKNCNMASCLRCPWMNPDVSSWHCCLYFPLVKLREVFYTVPILSCLPISSSEYDNFISLVWRVEIGIAKETIRSVPPGSSHTPELSLLFITQTILSVRAKSPMGQHNWTAGDITHRKKISHWKPWRELVAWVEEVAACLGEQVVSSVLSSVTQCFTWTTGWKISLSCRCMLPPSVAFGLGLMVFLLCLQVSDLRVISEWPKTSQVSSLN